MARQVWVALKLCSKAQPHSSPMGLIWAIIRAAWTICSAGTQVIWDTRSGSYWAQRALSSSKPKVHFSTNSRS